MTPAMADFLRKTRPDLPLCPKCSEILNVEKWCNHCQWGKPQSKPVTVKAYADIGRELVSDNNWGRRSDGTLSELIQSGDMPLDTVALLVTLVRELRQTKSEIVKAVDRLSRVVEKAPLKAEIALEKERQKTADKQRKANEAAPPVVKIFQVPSERISRLKIRHKY